MTNGRNLGRRRNEDVTGSVVTGGCGILSSNLNGVTTSTTSTTKNNNNNNSRYIGKLGADRGSYRRNRRFVGWLRGQIDRLDCVGDLARDSMRCVSPLGSTAGYHALVLQMRSLGACDDALMAAERAYAEFCAEQP